LGDEVTSQTQAIQSIADIIIHAMGETWTLTEDSKPRTSTPLPMASLTWPEGPDPWNIRSFAYPRTHCCPRVQLGGWAGCTEKLCVYEWKRLST